jgi:hypothetical protein
MNVDDLTLGNVHTHLRVFRKLYDTPYPLSLPKFYNSYAFRLTTI